MAMYKNIFLFIIVIAAVSLSGYLTFYSVSVLAKDETKSMETITKDPAGGAGSNKTSLLDKTADLRSRYKAVSNAWKTENRSILSQLNTVLNDPSEPRSIRITAARSLAKAGRVELVDQVKQIIGSTEDNNLAYGLVSAMGELRHPRAVELLVQLTEEYNATLRYKAIQSLGKTRDKSSKTVNALKKSARNDPDKYNRVRAIIALGQMGKDEVLPFIRQRRDREKDQFVKHVCEKQIGLLENK